VAQPKLNLSILKTLLSKTVMVGVLDIADEQVETPGTIAACIRDALKYTPPKQVIVAPDCDMKYLSRELAFAKLSAMVEGANIVRQEISE
jgi:5-methyltetrahydropteroyltriglutamate--homocysteine methyltransferase|tara:strand:- start:250 stop:519 length:270 start_codon:yes stop_codon:yes gene_type:complete